MPMEVWGDFETTVGPVAKEGLHAGLKGEIEDFDAEIDKSADGVGLAGAAGPHEKDVHAGQGEGWFEF